ncbi:hypothetical protein CYMTET_44132 [Cymbomonas tetramitiformis]|uniref:Uncharacterized protein n=1 Tax=Cymbomonas tetramitiformis TaxID=36881 RepID=A0AAE0C207_9CHLO|nr:hypothetical protein CYMTET_44134 [Cymbomonas tetramitiformis]KAK3246329.1 hypothetical protein CYMTET_44132 [Cymbomonas tetramitiformis]
MCFRQGTCNNHRQLFNSRNTCLQWRLQCRPTPLDVWRERHDEEKKKSTALEAQVAAEQKARKDLYQELLAARAETVEAKRAAEFEKKLSAVRGDSQSDVLVNGALFDTPGARKGSKAVHFDEGEDTASPERRSKKKSKKKKSKKSKYSSSDSSSESDANSQGDTTSEDTKKRRRNQHQKRGAGAAAINKQFKTQLAKQKLELILVKFGVMKPEEALMLEVEKTITLAAKAHREGGVFDVRKL